MLYKAAYGNNISKKEMLKLQKMPQEKINTLVLEWAKKAGWVTKNKIGTDGKSYTSFWPN